MADKEKTTKKRYGIYLDEDIYIKLRELSKDRRLSISAVITQYVLSDHSLSNRGKEELKKRGFDPEI